jgi:hypothetical protein
MRGGRNIPTLQQAWSLKGKLMVKMHRGQLIVQKWPGKYGPPRSQAQADTITAFKQIQRGMKSQLPQEWVTAIERTKLTGMYPRDYLFSCMSGNMHLVENFLTGAISAAVDRLQAFLAVGGETTVIFAGIPPGYQALRLEILGRSLKAATEETLSLSVNADTAAHYDATLWDRFGYVTAPGTTVANCGELPAATAPANYPGQILLQFPQYSNTGFFKLIAGQSNYYNSTTATDMRAELWIAYWRSLAAITQLQVNIPSGLVKGSALTLHGFY